MLRGRPSLVIISQEDMEEYNLRRTRSSLQTRNDRYLIPRRPTGLPPTRNSKHSAPPPSQVIVRSGPSRRVTDAIVTPSVKSHPNASHAIHGHSIQHHSYEDEDENRSDDYSNLPQHTSALSNYLSNTSREQAIHVGRSMPVQLHTEHHSPFLASQSMPLLQAKKENDPSGLASVRSKSCIIRGAGRVRAPSIHAPSPIQGHAPASGLISGSSEDQKLSPLDSSPLDELMTKLRMADSRLEQVERSPFVQSELVVSTPLLHGHTFYSDRTDQVDHVMSLRADPWILPGEARQTHSDRDRPRNVERRRATSRMTSYPMHSELQDAVSPRAGIRRSTHSPSPHPFQHGVESNWRESPTVRVQDVSQIQTPRRTPLRAAVRASRTPRLPVYDDGLPAAFQPQTPAELRTRQTGLPGSRYAVARRRNAISRDLHPAMIPPGESRYPTVTAPVTAPTLADDRRSPTFESVSGHNLGGPRTQMRQQENVQEELSPQMDEERRRWAGRRDNPGRASALMQTPPHEGRFERFLR
ncbi:hypothetical protein BDZ85DRAFT_4837 [Elsinoe ampelina]|uniref:Uncharacterized protein n=1 Tax=Elsinoe ampelina TaxID=302913 RepID=A0A6A6GP86_9PEZI|nr:hypothetical protein BDZ85DRAFT_4837 [Elsinoe ampelina]